MLCGVKLTCPLRRLISFFLLVADPAMLCGEKAVIFTVLLLLAASNPVAWESTACWMEDYRLLGRCRVYLLVSESMTDYGDVVADARRCVGRPR